MSTNGNIITKFRKKIDELVSAQVIDDEEEELFRRIAALAEESKPAQISALGEIREIVEDKPGQAMQDELVELVRDIKRKSRQDIWRGSEF